MLSCLKAKNTINVPEGNKTKTSTHKIFALIYDVNSAYHHNLFHHVIDRNMIKNEPELFLKVMGLYPEAAVELDLPRF